MYYNGKGVGQDYAKAAELFEKACNEGDAWGCYVLGNMYEYGRGVRQNNQTALEYYGKACDLGDQLGCENYAKLKKELGL